MRPTLLLLLKALLPGARHFGMADLFATPTQVKGHTDKHGTYIAPHTALRRKRLHQPAAPASHGSAEPEGTHQPAQADLFGGTPAPAPKQLLLFGTGKSKTEPPRADTPAPSPAPTPSAESTPPAPAAPAAEPVEDTRQVRPSLRDSAGPPYPRAEFEFGTWGDDYLTVRTPRGPGIAGPMKEAGARYQSAQGLWFAPLDCEDAVHAAVARLTGTTAPGTAPLPEATATPEPTAEPEPAAAPPESTPAAPEAAPEPSPKAKPKRKPAAKPAPAAALPPEPEPGARELVKPDQMGVRAGVTEAERRRLNAAAVALLAAKGDAAMTHEDRLLLAKYSGNGGCGDSLNEFYTDPAVADSVWWVLGRAGFTGGTVLEPSCGTGVFLATAPRSATVTGVEFDATSARIARILHPGHDVQPSSSLERFATTDGRRFDAVVGNCPFGLRGGTVVDDKPDLVKAEQYFLDTALDKLRDGGLVAMIVPTGVMDSTTGRAFRERLARKAEFLGAARLPNTAFAASHTDVTSDVVVFRKRPQDVAGALMTVDRSTMHHLGLLDPEVVAGTYFTEGRGADNVFGTLEDGWRAKAGIGHDITVSGSMQGVPLALEGMKLDEPKPGPDLDRVLSVLEDDAAKRRALNGAVAAPYQVAQVGDTKVVAGIAYVLQGDPARWHRVDEELTPAVQEAIALGDLLHRVDAEGEDAAYARIELGDALDRWVATHGAPAANKQLRAWLARPVLPEGPEAEENPEHGNHAARVEETRRRTARVLGAVADDGTYSDLVTGHKRAVEAAGLETVAEQMSLERGGFTAHALAAATGRPLGEVLDQLHASPVYALLPDGQSWTLLNHYVSGELWAKYDAATAAAAAPEATPAQREKWQHQAATLEAAIAPASLEDVEVGFNSGFVSPEDITAWFAARYAAEAAEHPTSTYYQQRKPPVFSVHDGVMFLNGETHAHRKGWGPESLVMDFVNRVGVKKDELDELATLTGQFKDWLLTSDRRDAVEERYNRTYRGFRAPVYDDSPIAIPGLNPDIDVNRYHWSGLRWALAEGKGIVADDVGLGKTARGLMLAKLLKSTGQRQKPVIVVPKQVLSNWMREAEFWFPGSRVLVIGETYSTNKAGETVAKPDSDAVRRAKLHQLAQNDYDFVLFSKPAWERVNVSPELKEHLDSEDFWNQRREALDGGSTKKLNKVRTSFEQLRGRLRFRAKTEDTLHFEDLGIDAMLMDEGHAYKGLYSVRKRFGESPRFLGGSGQSKTALDTQHKSEVIRRDGDGRGVFMLTATPTKNSPLEVYSMLAHIAPEAFKRMGITNAEDFIDRFCEFKNDLILDTDGSVEEALVTAGFKNLDELREVMRRFIDRKTAEDVALVIPKGEQHQHMVEMTPAQLHVYDQLRAKWNAPIDPDGTAHPFRIMSDMGKAALDLALLYDGAKDGHMPKVDACVKEAVERSEDGGQIIFCDANAVHEKIAAKLVAAGVPRTAIGIINAEVCDNGAKLQKVVDDYNAGRIRFVVGNTAKMGEGVNLQKNTSDIHHLDLPWNPAGMQQRNGRGVRQGNKQGSVRLHSYLAKRSFDGYRLQTLNAKKDWQDLLWHGGNRVENLAQEGNIGREEALILMSDDPEQARAAYDANKEAAMQRYHAAQLHALTDSFTRYNKLRVNLAKLAADKKPGRTESASAVRMAQQAAKLREQLAGNALLTDHGVLDGDAPAHIDPSTGAVFAPGRPFTVLPQSEGGPFNWSATPSLWTVHSVDPVARKVKFALVGDNPYNLSADMDKLGHGVLPANAEEVDAERAKHEAARVAREGRYASYLERHGKQP